jgi:hypothetical protein
MLFSIFDSLITVDKLQEVDIWQRGNQRHLHYLAQGSVVFKVEYVHPAPRYVN